MNNSFLPIITISIFIVLIWYSFSIVLNSSWALDKAERSDRQLSFSELVQDTWSQKKPKLPTPHQVGYEMWKTIFDKKVTSKRSLVYHGWITLSATLAGFILGTILGVLLALAIVHDKATDLSVMPWIITSQTIPILALAPMIIVVLSSIGFTGLMPKAVISMYLSFFPIVVGMVKGLRSPDLLEIDQMKTWSASRFQILIKLRLPKSIPFLFTSLKLGMAASLVGAIVGELPSGAIAGLGARMLSGSYYGQTIQIWSALFTAAILAASLVGLIGIIQAFVFKRMMITQ
ncbi:MAG: ABC transporter permease [Paracoccaceae bacterium]|nr:ABC transporter permease [Paracoccaceae bacterium]